MAGWVADYISDFGKTFKCVRLNSRLVNHDGTSSKTTSLFDKPFLPAVFTDATKEASNTRGCCSLIVKPRAVKLWRSDNSYLYLEYPFQPTTGDYLAFMSELDGNNQIVTVERVGERLDDFYTNLFV